MVCSRNMVFIDLTWAYWQKKRKKKEKWLAGDARYGSRNGKLAIKQTCYSICFPYGVEDRAPALESKELTQILNLPLPGGCGFGQVLWHSRSNFLIFMNRSCSEYSMRIHMQFSCRYRIKTNGIKSLPLSLSPSLPLWLSLLHSFVFPLYFLNTG